MLVKMRTTLDINDDLLQRAKRRAVDQGAPLRAVVEDALRSYLSQKPQRGKFVWRWKTDSGKLQPGVRLDDHSLFDRMDGLD